MREEEEEEKEEEEEEEEEEEGGEDSNLSKLDGDSIVLWCYLFSLPLRCSRTSVGLLLRGPEAARRRQGVSECEELRTGGHINFFSRKKKTAQPHTGKKEKEKKWSAPPRRLAREDAFARSPNISFLPRSSLRCVLLLFETRAKGKPSFT